MPKPNTAENIRNMMMFAFAVAAIASSPQASKPGTAVDPTFTVAGWPAGPFSTE